MLQRAETRWIEARCYSGVEGNSSAVQCSVVLGSYPRGSTPWGSNGDGVGKYVTTPSGGLLGHRRDYCHVSIEADAKNLNSRFQHE